MATERERKRIHVLTGRETRFWHSPFSKELRERRRARILERCEQGARRAGMTEFDVYDAFETLVATGSVAD